MQFDCDIKNLRLRLYLYILKTWKTDLKSPNHEISLDETI